MALEFSPPPVQLGAVAAAAAAGEKGTDGAQRGGAVRGAEVTCFRDLKKSVWLLLPQHSPRVGATALPHPLWIHPCKKTGKDGKRNRMQTM